MVYLYLEPEPRFDVTHLNEVARETVASMGLITHCAEGSTECYRALLVGFKYYVNGFDVAIARNYLRMMQRDRLARLYGPGAAAAHVESAVQTMRERSSEEGEHSKIWRQDIRTHNFDSRSGIVLPGVKLLLQYAYVDDPCLWFAHLATTEFVARWLAVRLYSSPPFMEKFFPTGRWEWGHIHLEPEDLTKTPPARHASPGSHLDMDLDEARARHLLTLPAQTARSRLEEADSVVTLFIEDRLRLFLYAAQEVYAHRHLFTDRRP